MWRFISDCFKHQRRRALSESIEIQPTDELECKRLLDSPEEVKEEQDQSPMLITLREESKEEISSWERVQRDYPPQRNDTRCTYFLYLAPMVASSGLFPFFLYQLINAVNARHKFRDQYKYDQGVVSNPLYPNMTCSSLFKSYNLSVSCANVSLIERINNTVPEAIIETCLNLGDKWCDSFQGILGLGAMNCLLISGFLGSLVYFLKYLKDYKPVLSVQETNYRKHLMLENASETEEESIRQAAKEAREVKLLGSGEDRVIPLTLIDEYLEDGPTDQAARRYTRLSMPTQFLIKERLPKVPDVVLSEIITLAAQPYRPNP